MIVNPLIMNYNKIVLVRQEKLTPSIGFKYEIQMDTTSQGSAGKIKSEDRLHVLPLHIYMYFLENFFIQIMKQYKVVDHYKHTETQT